MRALRRTAKTDSGVPTTATSVALCLSDQTNGKRKLLATAPAGRTCRGKPCWKETDGGFGYRDPDATPDALTNLVLKSGAPEKAKLTARGKRASLPLEALPLPTPLRMEVRRDDAPTC